MGNISKSPYLLNGPFRREFSNSPCLISRGAHLHILRKEIASFRRRSSGSVPRTHSGVKERLPSAVSQVEKATRGMCCPRGPSHITLSIDLSFSKIWGIFSPNYHIILFPLKFHSSCSGQPSYCYHRTNEAYMCEKQFSGWVCNTSGTC